jgi:aquaporin Z
MKFIYELIGTFFLMLTVGMCVINTSHPEFWAPVAIGSVLAVMVYAGGHVSGGHYNPAVSLAVFLRKKITLETMFFYWIAQLVGATLAAFATIHLKGEPATVPLQPVVYHALLAEFLFTFALCFVVLNVATVRATEGNSYFGWAIGFTVLVGAYAVGAISGGAFNPAVALGITILNLSLWSNIWIFIVANLLGAVAAAIVVNRSHVSG